ncbi:transcriptional regulator, partial [Streptomonospora algeriensis]
GGHSGYRDSPRPYGGHGGYRDSPRPYGQRRRKSFLEQLFD